VIFKADSGSGYKIYRVAVGGGSEVALDDVFEYSVSPVVGSHLIAYGKPLTSTSEVYTIDYLTGTQTPVTSLGVDVFSPNWSRDGQNIIFGFSHEAVPTTENYHLFNATYPGGVVTQVTPATSSSVTFGFYNSTMTQLVEIGIGTGATGVFMDTYTIGAGTNNPLISDNNLGNTCYWTDANGRANSVNIPSYLFGKHDRRFRR
jgi:hypothetical protein